MDSVFVFSDGRNNSLCADCNVSRWIVEVGPGGGSGNLGNKRHEKWRQDSALIKSLLMAVMQCLIYTWRGRGWAKAEMISFQRARPGRFRFQRSVVMLRLR